MTLTPDSEPNELFTYLDEEFTGKFDATTENHIWAAFLAGVEAGRAEMGPQPGDESVDAELERVINGLEDILAHSSATRRVGNALDAALRLREKLKVERA